MHVHFSACSAATTKSLLCVFVHEMCRQQKQISLQEKKLSIFNIKGTYNGNVNGDILQLPGYSPEQQSGLDRQH